MLPPLRLPRGGCRNKSNSASIEVDDLSAGPPIRSATSLVGSILSRPSGLLPLVSSEDEMNSLITSFVESQAEDAAVNEVNEEAAKRIAQKDPYKLPIPQGLSKRDQDVLRRCRRRAHQLDHNAVFCYCCPCFFGLNTAICTSSGYPGWDAES
jgi:hypothetical protein